jgi:hypothetical protein
MLILSIHTAENAKQMASEMNQVSTHLGRVSGFRIGLALSRAANE